MSHETALRLRLSNEKSRLASAKNKSEIELRKIWISQIEKELELEKDFPIIADEEISDENLLNLLFAE